MATIDYSIEPEDGYTGDYNIEAYTQAAPTVKVGETPEAYPHSNPMVGEITVPSSEPHFVRVRAVACDEIVGEFPVEPAVAECPAPGAVTISSITGTTATASWVAAATAPADGYNWRLVRLDGVTEVPVTSGNTGSLSVNLTSLLGGNDYRFYVGSECSEELSSNESMGNFHTTDPTPPDPPGYDTYSRRFLFDGSPIENICGGSVTVVFYVSYGAPLYPGTTFWLNSSLTTPLTGYSHVLLDGSAVNTIGPSTGVLGGATGQTC